jgi:hypothetical protein
MTFYEGRLRWKEFYNYLTALAEELEQEKAVELPRWLKEHEYRVWHDDRHLCVKHGQCTVVFDQNGLQFVQRPDGEIINTR